MTDVDEACGILWVVKKPNCVILMAHVTLVNLGATVLNLHWCVRNTHSKQVAKAQAHEALVTLDDFGQLKPYKTAAAKIANCWEESRTH